MLNQLTKYLLQYRRVSIPSVGTIRLIQQPAQLNVVDKIILPPSFAAEVNAEDSVTEHQLQFLSASLNEEKGHVLQSLNELGQRLKKSINEEGFEWKGIGLIRHSNEAIPVSAVVLEPVSAERVLRQDAEHNVLVGDQQMTSTQIAGLKEEGVAENKRSIYVIIGWIILVLSILYIVFILYQGKFRMVSTGSKQAPTSLLFSPQERTQEDIRLSSL